MRSKPGCRPRKTLLRIFYQSILIFSEHVKRQKHLSFRMGSLSFWATAKLPTTIAIIILIVGGSNKFNTYIYFFHSKI